MNKARTREAIITALQELLVDRPAEAITIEELAEAAGISRRTFFNYFPGLSAVVSATIEPFTLGLTPLFRDMDPTRSPLEGMREILRGPGLPRELLEFLATLHRHLPAEPSEATLTLERQVWSEQTVWLQSVLREELAAEGDEIYTATLASVVMNSFAITERVWAGRHSWTQPLSDEAIADYHALLDQALAHAAAGWAPQ